VVHEFCRVIPNVSEGYSDPINHTLPVQNLPNSCKTSSQQ